MIILDELCVHNERKDIMGLKEAYHFMEQKHMFAFSNNKECSMLTKTYQTIEHRNQVLDHYSKLMTAIQRDIKIYGEEEIIWIYFKEEKGLFIPYSYIIPKYNQIYKNEPNIETLLKNGLLIFELASQ